MNGQEINYGYEQLFSIPSEMGPWNLRLDNPQPSEFGQYVLVGCEQASIELHHQVDVIDESGLPLRNVWVIFGFPGGGPNIALGVSGRNYWVGSPAVLKGNAQKTTGGGYAQHTFSSGGEDIWIWDIDSDGDLKLPSPIVRNCTWQRTPVGMFEHTGVKLTFQRRRVGVVPLEQRLQALEAGGTTGGLPVTGGSSAELDELRRRIEALEQLIG